MPLLPTARAANLSSLPLGEWDSLLRLVFALCSAISYTCTAETHKLSPCCPKHCLQLVSSICRPSNSYLFCFTAWFWWLGKRSLSNSTKNRYCKKNVCFKFSSGGGISLSFLKMLPPPRKNCVCHIMMTLKGRVKTPEKGPIGVYLAHKHLTEQVHCQTFHRTWTTFSCRFLRIVAPWIFTIW